MSVRKGIDESGFRHRTGWLRAHWRVLLVGVVVCYLLALAVSALVAGLSLRSAQREGQTLSSTIKARNVTTAGTALRHIRPDVARARTALWGPLWAPVAALPLIGDDVRAVRTTVITADELLEHDVPPLVRTISTLHEGARRPDASIDTTVLLSMQQSLAARVPTVTARARKADALRLDHVLPALRDPLSKALGLIDQVAQADQLTADGLLVATSVLGAHGPQTTMIAVQNPSEARGTGGLIGAFALVEGNRGKLTLKSTGVNDELLPYPTPLKDVPADVLQVYGPAVRDVRNVNLSPDFPVAAKLLTDTYTRAARHLDQPSLGTDPMLVTLTPVALGRLLKVTGPVDVLGGKQVRADNAAKLFGNKVYADLPTTKARSAYVQLVLQAVFLRLIDSDIDPLRLLDALRSVSTTHNLMGWSAGPRTQGALERLGTSGALRDPDGRTAQVSLVNSDGSKLDYFVRATVVLNAPGCALEVILANDAPGHVGKAIANPTAATSATSTDHQLTLQVHLPPTVGVLGLKVDGQPKAFASGRESGWTVIRIGVSTVHLSSSDVCLDLDGQTAAIDAVVPPVLSEPSVVSPPQANAIREDS